MNDTSPIICTYGLGPAGQKRLIEAEDVPEKLKSNQLVWVHLDAKHPDAKQWLRNHVPNTDSLIHDALLAEETRPRVAEYRDGTLIILRGVNLNESQRPEDMISIRIWIDEWRIITTRFRKLKAVQDIRERIEQGKGPENAAEFLCTLTSRLFERMEPVIQDLDNDTDESEEKILNSAETALRQDIIEIRRKAIELRRYIAPQKDVIAYLRSSELPWLDQTARRHLQESLDRVTRYVEELDAIRERSQLVKDEMTNIHNEGLNKNMYILSVVAGIFLPLSFFTGLLGINVGGMPGAESDSAFWIVCLICFGFAGLSFTLLRFLKWV